VDPRSGSRFFGERRDAACGTGGGGFHDARREAAHGLPPTVHQPRWINFFRKHKLHDVDRRPAAEVDAAVDRVPECDIPDSIYNDAEARAENRADVEAAMRVDDANYVMHTDQRPGERAGDEDGDEARGSFGYSLLRGARRVGRSLRSAFRRSTTVAPTQPGAGAGRAEASAPEPSSSLGEPEPEPEPEEEEEEFAWSDGEVWPDDEPAPMECDDDGDAAPAVTQSQPDEPTEDFPGRFVRPDEDRVTKAENVFAEAISAAFANGVLPEAEAGHALFYELAVILSRSEAFVRGIFDPVRRGYIRAPTTTPDVEADACARLATLELDFRASYQIVASPDFYFFKAVHFPAACEKARRVSRESADLAARAAQRRALEMAARAIRATGGDPDEISLPYGGLPALYEALERPPPAWAEEPEEPEEPEDEVPVVVPRATGVGFPDGLAGVPLAAQARIAAANLRGQDPSKAGDVFGIHTGKLVSTPGAARTSDFRRRRCLDARCRKTVQRPGTIIRGSSKPCTRTSSSRARVAPRTNAMPWCRKAFHGGRARCASPSTPGPGPARAITRRRSPRTRASRSSCTTRARSGAGMRRAFTPS